VFHTSAGDLPLLQASAGTALITVTATIGGLVAARRPETPVGWLLCGLALFGVAWYWQQRKERPHG
jgi:hypothetical protein